MNLIGNALDVLHENKDGREGLITIGGKIEGSNIKIWVEDNGGGIPEDKISRIFDPFFTTKEVGKGTGIGLYIVQKEIDKHHGKISVSSTPNQGTIFEILIPKENKSETENRKNL